MYTFQHRYLQAKGLKLPLRPGKYFLLNDFYECERKPRIGENCLAYIEYAKQTGKLIRVVNETFTVEK